MSTLGIQQTTWRPKQGESGLRENQRELMQWAFVKLDLGPNPPLYRDPDGVDWFIFDDWRFDLLMFARLATLANEVTGLPTNWKPPTIGNGQARRIDRVKVQAKAIELVQASIVLPQDIAYSDTSTNRYQDTIDANNGPAGMQGWGAVPDDWVGP